MGVLLVAACGQTSTRTSSPGDYNQGIDLGTTLSGKVAPGFTLTDQFGQSVSLREFRGKVVLLAFIDSQCTNVCPLTTSSMVEAKTLLGKAGDRLQLLGVDANPSAMTEQDLAAYSSAHGVLHQWQFLTGTLTQLEAVWNAYKIEVQIEQGLVDHTPALFLIDPHGRLRKVYLTQMSYSSIDQQAQVLAEEASKVLPSHPRLISIRSYRQIPSITPSIATKVPLAGGGEITLGPKAPPRLYLFFATWLDETSALGSELQGLDQYVEQARGRGLPALVAIDEASVEPSARSLPRFLHSLPSPLTYPIAVDRSGRVADGYGVRDQPWFIITSSGHAIWSHDGWLPAQTLAQQAKGALQGGKGSHG